MEDKFVVSKKFRLLTYILIAIGVLALAVGFATDSKRAWANYLLNNYYFISLAIGAAFFGAIQYIAQAGWSSAFKRVPEAMAAWLPFGAVLFVILLLGVPSLYQWSDKEVVEHNHLIHLKTPYLNFPFFAIRLIVFLAIWIFLTKLLRKLSLKENEAGGLAYFEKSEFYSKVFIFVLAITFSVFSVDMLMSLDAAWFSTIFAAKSFIAAFLHGSSIIALIVILLNSQGYYKIMNKSHVHDFTRYVFMAGIVWSYFNFAEYMLIWYGNIPEETVWFVHRFENPVFKTLFFVNIILNWLIPFIILMPKATSRNKTVLASVIILLIIGQYTELYYIIWPSTIHVAKFGLMEIGVFLGFAGAFALVVATWLAKTSLVPKNHPYLEESIHHHF
jgi:hypothetical protein